MSRGKCSNLAHSLGPPKTKKCLSKKDFLYLSERTNF